MRPAALSAFVFALMFAQPVLAQTPPGPTKPTAPTKPSITQPAAPRVTIPTAPATGQMELLCRNAGQTPPGNTAGHAQTSVLTYERVNIRDASGAHKTIYVPVDATIMLHFAPATGLVGSRGEGLTEGSCGLRTSVIAPVAGRPSLRLAVSAPPNFILTATDTQGSREHFAGSTAMLSLPPCASGVRTFSVNRTAPAEFFVELLTPGKTACVN
jgi:hypothetical protein